MSEEGWVKDNQIMLLVSICSPHFTEDIFAENISAQ
jgi:hypothetical protein